jgi:hypothetical protein
MSLAAAEPLNPAQAEVLELLGARSDDRPAFEPDIRTQLRADLEESLAPLVPVLDSLGETLWIAKHQLGSVHGCEVRFLAEHAAGFPGWSVATARGVIAHKAIELSVHWRGDPAPLELIDEAIARLEAGDRDLASWLQQVPEVERAELRADANDRLVKFLDGWPPLSARWRPVTESKLRLELCDGRVVLAGKVDLALGRAVGSTAGRVLIDLKTGGFSPVHLDDLRFYALIEAVRLGVPPRRLATYYLDQGRVVPEDVSGAMLQSVIARVADGATRMLELRSGGAVPVTRPGPACRWCSELPRCAPGTAHQALLEDAR